MLAEMQQRPEDVVGIQTRPGLRVKRLLLLLCAWYAARSDGLLSVTIDHKLSAVIEQ